MPTEMEISTSSGSSTTSCTLLDQPVGFKCLASLLGVGGTRLGKKASGNPDLRFGKHAHPEQTGDLDCRWVFTGCIWRNCWDFTRWVSQPPNSHTFWVTWENTVCLWTINPVRTNFNFQFVVFETYETGSKYFLWGFSSILSEPKSVYWVSLYTNFRFVRRGRASHRKRDLDDDGMSDWEEIASDLENKDELRQWLSTQSCKTTLLPHNQLVRKYLPPGTVMDLFEHYKSTQKLLGCHAVSHPLWLYSTIFLVI